ncbi:MAG: hypothetical protein QMD22_10780 [archaeon]|nr:hypothetical protein [archaeon]
MKPFEKEERGLKLIPPKPDVCQECACDHTLNEPHNRDSLYYQYYFYARHGRFPTWEDAIAHCDEGTKRVVREVISKESDCGIL